MKANLILAIAVTISAFLPGCTREADRNFPRVITLEATNITAEGATLNARISILKETDSIQCGFLIYNNKRSSRTNIGALEAEHNSKTGTFQAKTEIGMKDGEEYWYTAFVYDGTTLVVGNECSFISKGGMIASIVDMEPAKGNLFDTVTLRLSGTIGDISVLTVRFDNKAADIVDFKNDALKVIVPMDLSIKENPVSISTGNNTNVFATEFELYYPEIIDFHPAEAYPGETITINGLNFDPIPSRNVVKLNNVIATVVTSTPTQLEVIAPNLEGIDCQISNTIGSLVAMADGVIKIKNLPDPIVTDFYPAEVYPGRLVTINGFYFNVDPSMNTVKFNNTVAQVVSSSFSQIEVQAPDLEGMWCQISVTVGTRVGLASGLVNILNWPDYWKKMSDHPGNRLFKMGSFVIGDYGYTGLGVRLNHNYNLKFWRYDYTDDSWLEVAPFPGNTRVSPMAFAAGDKGYIISGSTLDSPSGKALRDFYEYNPGANAWTQLSDYPGNIQNDFIGWAQVVNDKAYITFGYQDFYSYVPSTNQWTKLPNPSRQLFSASTTFVAGDIIYVVGGFDLTGVDNREVWAYNTLNDTWTRKNDFPGEARRAAAGFGIEGKYYLGLGIKISFVNSVYKDFWRYDPQNDLWEKMPDFAGAANIPSFCMVLDNMAYIGAGYLSPNNLSSDVYCFNPTPQK